MKILQDGLLRKIGTAQVGAVKRFVAADRLKAANIGETNGDFDRLLLHMPEDYVQSATLAVNVLETEAFNYQILTSLGKYAVIHLCHFIELIEGQAMGKKTGPLLVNACANIANVVANDGNVWAVHAVWGSGPRGWIVGARSIGYRAPWKAHGLVLSTEIETAPEMHELFGA